MKKMNFYKCGRTALALGLAGTMLFTRPMHVSAVRSISEIEEEQSSIQSELNGLDSDMVALVTEMTTLQAKHKRLQMRKKRLQKHRLLWNNSMQP